MLTVQRFAEIVAGFEEDAAPVEEPPEGFEDLQSESKLPLVLLTLAD